MTADKLGEQQGDMAAVTADRSGEQQGDMAAVTPDRPGEQQGDMAADYWSPLLSFPDRFQSLCLLLGPLIL